MENHMQGKVVSFLELDYFFDDLTQFKMHYDG